MPGASFKRKVCEWRAAARHVYTIPFNSVKQSMADGTVISAFTPLFRCAILLKTTITTTRKSWSILSAEPRILMCVIVAGIQVQAGALTVPNV